MDKMTTKPKHTFCSAFNFLIPASVNSPWFFSECSKNILFPAQILPMCKKVYPDLMFPVISVLRFVKATV